MHDDLAAHRDPDRIVDCAEQRSQIPRPIGVGLARTPDPGMDQCKEAVVATHPLRPTQAPVRLDLRDVGSAFEPINELANGRLDFGGVDIPHTGLNEEGEVRLAPLERRRQHSLSVERLARFMRPAAP